jgi:hypothetical protein
MAQIVSRLLDRASEFLARRRGLTTLIGIGLVLLNYVLQFIPGLEGFARTNTLLHLGIAVGLFGLLLAQALG